MSSRHRPPPLLLLILLLISFSSFFGELTALHGCLPDQRSALLRLQRGFHSSSNLEPWPPGTDCCHWDGVACDGDSGRVTVLDLNGRGISGEIDPSLFNLTGLVSLNLAYNRFDGIPLPNSGFERLANLIHLNLSNSGFAGQVPVGISRLTRLVSLDLSTFYLNENSSSSLVIRDPDFRKLIGGLSNLRELYLDGVNISAGGSEWSRAVAASAPRLQVLSLASCSLSGPIGSELYGLRSLSKLYLDQNTLSSSVPEAFGNFSSLTVLSLSACRLRGLFPGGIFQLRNLTFLDVSDNPMLSGQLPGFPRDSSLKILELSNTNFSGYLPDSIGNLKSLTTLQLWNCSLSGTIPSSIGNLTQLVQLDLSLNKFSGPIPRSIIQWPRISEIILAHNRLNGSIPSSYGNGQLHSLTKLDLTNNLLSGPIPLSLFSLPSLRDLLLGRNQLSGQLEEFSNASLALSNVDLSSNKLQGEIPKSIFKLGGLTILSLASNNFSGTVALNSFRSQSNLSNLDLSNNMLSIEDGEDSSSLSSFPNITTLKLVSCNLTKLPGVLKYLDGINSLDLSNNRIGGVIPQWIWSIGDGSFTYLNLSFNMFTSVEGPLPNLPLPNLSMSSAMILDLHSNMLRGPILLPPANTIVLDYSNNSLSSSIPSNFSMYLNFTVFFSLSKNRLTGEVPPSICNASCLQVLDLSDNNFTRLIPSCLFADGNDLRVLNLRGNSFHGSMPQNFSEECHLHTLDLNGNQLKGRIPRCLANCKMLEVLDLGNNQLVDSFPYWLGNLSGLRVLVLRSNGFYGSIGHPPGRQQSNCTFSMLQILDLSDNKFNGSLPSEYFGSFKAMMVNSNRGLPTVGFSFLELSQSSYYQSTVTVTIKGLEMTLAKIWTIFTSIDFSNNNFDGSIPEVIGKLKSLYLLNMSHNALTGRIPPQIGDLTQLESLDLSWNRLSGVIPPQLTSLTFLSTLNLSINNLVGRIPQDHQFLTFANTSFLGNPGLCGDPLSNNCSTSSNVEPHSGSKISGLKTTVELNWQFIFTGLGFGGGLAAVVGPLMVWNRGKRWYNQHVDRMLLAIIALWVHRNCRDGKVGAEEGGGEDSMEQEGEGGRFCVFCTRLEFREGRVTVHHVQCSCPLLEDS